MEYKETWWYAVAYGAAQCVLGALPPRRLMDRDIRCTVGCISPRIDEDEVELLGMPGSVETGLRLGYQRIRGKERDIHRITFPYPCRLLIIPLGTYPPITLQCFLRSQSACLFPLDALHSGSRTWEAHLRSLDETLCVMAWRRLSS